MNVINIGIPEKLFDAIASGTGNSTALALPTLATQLTWQTSFGSAPASITVQLQTSLDNLNWNTIDTSTSTTGEDRTIATSALFIRARVNAISGGSGITVSLVCKTGFIGLTTPSSVTDGALALFDGTTGSKFKALAFPGGTTTFLRADGTFAVPAGGGGGGTPASPVNSIQYNNAGSFGGDANLTWDGISLTVGVGNFQVNGFNGAIRLDANYVAGLVTSGTVVDPAAQQVYGLDVTANFTPNADATYGPAVYGLHVTSIVSDSGTHQMLGPAVDGINITVISSAVDGFEIAGLAGIVQNAGDGASETLRGVYLLLDHHGSGAITQTQGTYITLTKGAAAGTITNAYGSYYQIINGGAASGITNAYGYYFAAVGGKATNAFPFWLDETGVFAIHAINTFNAVYQARPALYNPQFTKFTPGATNQERVVIQWESNVACIRTENGGTGTLRDINLAGAHIQHNGNVGIAAAITSGGLVGKTMTFVDGILTAFA